MIETVKYRVVSFPGLEPMKVYAAKDLEHAQKIADQHADDHPLIEKNTVTETGWGIVQG